MNSSYELVSLVYGRMLMQCVSLCSRERYGMMGCVINWKLMGVDGQKVHSFQKKKESHTGNCFHLDFFLTSFIVLWQDWWMLEASSSSSSWMCKLDKVMMRSIFYWKGNAEESFSNSLPTQPSVHESSS